jgi:hypothetical protein
VPNKIPWTLLEPVDGSSRNSEISDTAFFTSVRMSSVSASMSSTSSLHRYLRQGWRNSEQRWKKTFDEGSRVLVF